LNEAISKTQISRENHGVSAHPRIIGRRHNTSSGMRCKAAPTQDRDEQNSILELPNGIPSHDTFGRVFSLIDAEQFQLAFYTALAVRCRCEWIWAVNDILQGKVINIDGKCLHGSDDQKLGKRAIYMVSAWAVENEIALGQRKVDEKSNEITAIPELLKMLAISGCIVTIDAMGTQTNIARTIRAANADYLLSVKENQRHLFEDISTLFAVDQAQHFKYAVYAYK
jgi:predicted transposase YbfD/YdcC